MAMSKAQKNLFVTNRVYLINSIEPNEELCAHLRAGNHMTESMQEQIMVCAQITRAVTVPLFQFPVRFQSVFG